MQVRVAEQNDRMPIWPLRLSTWAVACIGLSVSVPVSLWVLVPIVEPVDPLQLVAVFLGLMAAESFNLEFEFRKQSVSWSVSEFAFVMALATIGGAWTAVAWAVGVGAVSLVQGYPRAKVVFNVTVVLLEACAAVAVLRLLPVGDISEPR